MKKSLFTLFLATSFFGFSQNEEDALRYSQTFIGGTARNISMAGAMTAIGGDYSASSQNPAAMGRFNKHNFIITPTIEYNSTNSRFYNNFDNYQSVTVKIGNISYMKAYQLPSDKYNGWVSLQLGAGYNRINSFESAKKYSGEIDSSIIHNFINEANGTNPDFIYAKHPWGAGLAYDTYAIDPNLDNTYSTNLTSGNAQHSRTIRTDGGMGEYSFAVSGNYKNKFYVGGTINIIRAKYESNFSHKETFTAQDSIWLNSLEYLGNLTTEGWGYNAKVGAIYLPTDKLRIGLAVHSPTFFKLNDYWGNDMKTNTDDPDFPIKYIKDEYKPTGEFDYRITTPLKANLSVGYIIKKKASIGTEIEFINYADSKLKSIRFSEAPYSFVSENNQIENLYRPRLNFKIGGEYRINPMLYLRAGYAYYSSPFSKESGVNTSATQFVTGGFGINLGDYYFDIALAKKNVSYEYYAYNPNLKGSTALFIENNFNFSASVGFRFK